MKQRRCLLLMPAVDGSTAEGTLTGNAGAELSKFDGKRRWRMVTPGESIELYVVDGRSERISVQKPVSGHEVVTAVGQRLRDKRMRKSGGGVAILSISATR